MRSDLQSLVNAPPVSAGQPLQSKLLVLTWLYLLKMAPNINFNLPNVVSKVDAMRGVTPDNMIDLQIQGLATSLGYGTNSFAQLLSTARGAINGQGMQQTGVPYQTAVTTGDYEALMNYALLTLAKMLNDPS